MVTQTRALGGARRSLGCRRTSRTTMGRRSARSRSRSGRSSHWRSRPRRRADPWAATVAAARNETELRAMTGRLLETARAGGSTRTAPRGTGSGPAASHGWRPAWAPRPAVSPAWRRRASSGPADLDCPRWHRWDRLAGGKRKPVGGGPGDVIDVDRRGRCGSAFPPGLLRPSRPVRRTGTDPRHPVSAPGRDYAITRLEPMTRVPVRSLRSTARTSSRVWIRWSSFLATWPR